MTESIARTSINTLSPSAPPNTKAAPLSVAQPSLLPGDAYIEILRDIIEPDGEEICLAIFADEARIDLPASLAAKLWPLVGSLVAVVRIGDRYFCGWLEAS